jgi:hypothetical protein
MQETSYELPEYLRRKKRPLLEAIFDGIERTLWLTATITVATFFAIDILWRIGVPMILYAGGK